MTEPVAIVTARWCTCPDGQHPDATLTTPGAPRTGCGIAWPVPPPPLPALDDAPNAPPQESK